VSGYTVLGASGFIGRHVVHHLRQVGATVATPARDEPGLFAQDLGHVIDCAGLTARWRAQPLEAIRAHVGRTVELVARGRFTSLLYLSSTRVYKRAAAGDERAILGAFPAEPDDVFDLSKMLGEAAALGDPRGRVARLSNVFGDDVRSDNFLSSILRDAVRGRIELQTSLASTKDYVSVDDVAALLPRICVAPPSPTSRIVNVGSGVSTTNGAIVDELVRITGCTLTMRAGAPTTTFPPISIDLARRAYDFAPRPLVPALAALVDTFRRDRAAWEGL
jgi:nucleoside-diphosphate-sugar epimerase